MYSDLLPGIILIPKDAEQMTARSLSVIKGEYKPILWPNFLGECAPTGTFLTWTMLTFSRKHLHVFLHILQITQSL